MKARTVQVVFSTNTEDNSKTCLFVLDNNLPIEDKVKVLYDYLTDEEGENLLEFYEKEELTEYSRQVINGNTWFNGIDEYFTEDRTEYYY